MVRPGLGIPISRRTLFGCRPCRGPQLPPVDLAVGRERNLWNRQPAPRNQGSGQHPPQALCLGCGSGDLSFQPVSGKGRIHSFAIMRHDHYPSFRDRLPYVNLWVELDEQPFLIVIANLLEAAPEEAAIGKPVEVVFQEISDEITLPQFRLIG